MAPVQTRYVKIKTEWDDRDGDWNFVNKAEFFNSPDSLIKIFYTISNRDEAYTYDDNNNRVTEEVTLRGTVNRTYWYYPNTDKLLTDGRYAYQYDGEGNLTAKGTYLETTEGTQAITDLTASFWSTVESSTDGITIAAEYEWWRYEYDAFNRLISVNKNGEEVAEYTYNAANLRVETIKPDETTYYAFSLHGKLLFEDDGTTERIHTYATGRHFAVDETEGSDTTRYFTHTDHLGSVTAVTNSDGTLVWNNEYLPFGDEAKTTNSRFAMFTGKQKDVDTGLFYYNARWYDASLGRFVSQDPIRSG